MKYKFLVLFKDIENKLIQQVIIQAENIGDATVQAGVSYVAAVLEETINPGIIFGIEVQML